MSGLVSATLSVKGGRPSVSPDGVTSLYHYLSSCHLASMRRTRVQFQCLSYLSCCRDEIRFILVCSLKVQFIISGKAWQRELEASTWGSRMEAAGDANTQLTGGSLIN